MAVGITEEHEALRLTARRWLESRCPPSVPRQTLDASEDSPPPFWDELAGQGWLGLHLSEDHGGQGFGFPELAVVLEELGRAVAPGPFLSTVVASSLIAERGTTRQRESFLPRLAGGSAPATVALGAGELAASAEGDSLVLEGTLRPVVSAALAELLIVPARKARARGPVWCVLDRGDLEVRGLASLDPTRRVAEVVARGVRVGPERQLRGLGEQRAMDIAAALAAAEAAGGLAWCLETASSYAKVREQFGRPIGQFQAVKHRLADMLVSLERGTATAWDAAGVVASAADDAAGLAAAVAAVTCLDGFAEGAKGCIQILGGIGFTWEHDAHLYLKRAMALRQLLGGTDRWRARVASLALGGSRRSLASDLVAALPAEEAGRQRDTVARDIAGIAAAPKGDRRRRMVELGYVVPHWPPPWGRGASPLEQLVIDEEMEKANLRRPHLQIGAWAVPTIVAYGTPEQQERWVRPTLLGELSWCQMFSEPGAGSDLANLSTKAVKVEGGWRLSGQKVWTSMARQADLAICLARTNSDAPKHDGISYFIVDMRSEGIDIRPLRELTGAAMFNEIFLSDVFVPDDCVIGEVDDGWRLARTTLANERVSMSSGSSFGGGVEGLLELVAREEPGAVVTDQVGALVAEAQSLALLGHRATLRALSGVDPGPESSVRKLLGVEHEQRVQELGLVALGSEGSTVESEAGRWTYGFLANRCLTIAGGTSEVQRNLIAERLLGLPRDPDPGG